MKMLLKAKHHDYNIMNNKKAEIPTLVWIAFYTLLALAIAVVLYKIGVFNNQAFASLKQKVFPFA